MTFCNMQSEMGKTKKRGYFCYPGLMYSYGLPYPPKTESVALGTYSGDENTKGRTRGSLSETYRKTRCTRDMILFFCTVFRAAIGRKNR